ncbi:MAG: hypothetical protein HOV81_16785 [Kofleriaceae bacterium]|nr:hypothetical protein [Kofleriaceae bacterium]
MRSVIASLVVVMFVASATAAPRKILVLPLDGNAPPAQRTSLNASVAKLAKANIDGDVTIGDTTFNETAAAVGCSPDQAACAETVMSTLAVDELVYGIATTQSGTTTVVVNRAVLGTPARTQNAAISDSAPGEQAEGGLAALFGAPAAGPGEAGSAAPAGGVAVTEPTDKTSFFDTRERRIGFGAIGVGAATMLVGMSLWISESSMQGDIDDHPTESLDDLRDLHDLEDRAATKALWGNILVGAGLVLGGVGAYYLYKDNQNRKLTVTPAPTEAGMTLVLGGRW